MCSRKPHLEMLKSFCDLCIEDPNILQKSDRTFLASFIEAFGGDSSQHPSMPSTFEVEEPDTGAPGEMGNPLLQTMVKEMIGSENLRRDYEKAIQLTLAIVKNPINETLYINRAHTYLSLDLATLCIRDCDRALELNSCHPVIFKYRGRAHHLLGNWEEAVNDLGYFSKFDDDEEAIKWLEEAKLHVFALEQRKKKEHLLQEQKEKDRQIEEAAKKQRENANDLAIVDFLQFLNDPDIVRAFQDPDVTEAFKDISSNPVNIFKYQGSEKIMSLINKVASKFGGANNACPGMPELDGGSYS